MATFFIVMNIINIRSISNYNSFEFCDFIFDYSSYSKLFAKYHIFLLWFILITKVFRV